MLTLVFAASAVATTLKNITITVPDGTSDHGNPNLLCTPTKWTDIVIFFLGNYLAHAATVIALPGESAVSMGMNALLALVLPWSGVNRGISAISICAKRGRTALQTAQRAQALCMLARTADWRPQAGDSVSNCVLKLSTVPLPTSAVARVYRAPWTGTTTESVPKSSAIHGSTSLPPDSGYQLVLVPEDADLLPPPITESEVNADIACNYNALKILVALGQSIYAITTFYNTQRDQIARYGYAAFGLTVTPYAIMSLINLIGALMTPQYPCLYMVGSSIMDEAQSRGCYFQGTVGRLAEVESEQSQHLESEEGHFQLLNRPTLFQQVDGAPLNTQVYVSTNNGQYSLQSGQPEPLQDHTTDIEMSSVQHQEESVVLQIGYEHKRTAALPQDHHSNEEVVDDATRETLIPQTPRNHADQFITFLFVPDSSRTRLRSGGIGQRSPRILSTTLHQTQFNENQITTLFEPSLADDSFFDLRFFAFLLGSVSLAIIGGLSKFRKGESTVAQRGWMISWFVVGLVIGAWVNTSVDKHDLGRIRFLLLIYSAPAIGGFIVVGQMLGSYGTCVRIS